PGRRDLLRVHVGEPVEGRPPSNQRFESRGPRAERPHGPRWRSKVDQLGGLLPQRLLRFGSFNVWMRQGCAPKVSQGRTTAASLQLLKERLRAVTELSSSPQLESIGVR